MGNLLRGGRWKRGRTGKPSSWGAKERQAKKSRRPKNLEHGGVLLGPLPALREVGGGKEVRPSLLTAVGG